MRTNTPLPRARKATAPETPYGRRGYHARHIGFLRYCERHRLSPALECLLVQALEGHRGDALSQRLGLSTTERFTLELRFRLETGQSLADAARELSTREETE
ncbi:MAG TPA: hypothetical protein RMH85_21325 [Polyangiaceae bacterium LLY-WYZ-15_(1-7)]|nr:hypothetical protein [Myxococcales bacterium]MAT28091.1 hypothetical protein [Sandaracinus sp.]HJK93572.1 hypothetical protein [Polyangiaceae bacterium LLY-WYZ-15_(1-7)]MBJ70242.1 hypothetical protein [Sandaracinus sp.]HJL00386.1 hypothetical protein [Polyangiaceae bacterium LLY-WYZ-15_(1-7)]